MNEDQILMYMTNYFCRELGDEDDLQMALEGLNENGSLGFFYYITKKFEESLSKNKQISQEEFQTIMSKWFLHSVENLSFISM